MRERAKRKDGGPKERVGICGGPQGREGATRRREKERVSCEGRE